MSKHDHPGTGSATGRRGLLVGAVALLVGAAAAGVFLFDGGEVGPGEAPNPLASTDAPMLGEPGAKVHIVEFLDPACETCAMFYPYVKQLIARNPGRIRLSLRHVPFHEGSEYAVRLLEASRAQDKYWQTLETLLASQAMWAPNHVVRAELVNQAVSGVGLDMDRLAADMNSPEVIRRAEQDLGDAMALKIRATPEYFVNGRPLPSFGWQQLESLVAEELAKAY